MPEVIGPGDAQAEHRLSIRLLPPTPGGGGGTKPRRYAQRRDGVCCGGEIVAPQDGGRPAAATGAARPRARRKCERTHGAPTEDGGGLGAVSVAQADGRARVWDHQRSHGLPTVSAARSGEGVAGMDVGVPELQPQTALHAQTPSGGGLNESENAGGRPKARAPRASHEPERLRTGTGRGTVAAIRRL